jgi:hypothetical protein
MLTANERQTEMAFIMYWLKYPALLGIEDKVKEIE